GTLERSTLGILPLVCADQVISQRPSLTLGSSAANAGAARPAAIAAATETRRSPVIMMRPPFVRCGPRWLRGDYGGGLIRPFTAHGIHDFALPRHSLRQGRNPPRFRGD